MLVIISAIYEMLHNGQTVQRMVDRHVDMVFEKMDTDKDGVISREEFMNSCKNVRSISVAFSLVGREVRARFVIIIRKYIIKKR